MKYLFSIFFLTFILTVYSQSCTHTIQLTDTYGDGWNGGRVAVSVNSVAVLTNLGSTFTTGLGPVSFNFTATSGQTIRVYRTTAGTYPSEMRIRVINSLGTVIINTVQPVTGTATTGGSIGISACSAPTPPTNDACSNATSLPCGTSSLAGTTVNTVSEVAPLGNSSNFGVWYQFTGDGQSTTITSTTTFDHELDIMTGSSCGSFVIVSAVDASVGTETYTFTAVNGQQYYIYVAHYLPGNTTTGTFTMSKSCTPVVVAPANDLVCNATTILCGSTTSGTTVNSTTTGTYEGVTTCGVSQTMPGVWYKIVGDGQTMSASLCGTVWDSKISVFSGSSCTALTCLGGIDDDGPSCVGTSASYQWSSVVGTIYWIKVYGYSTNTTFSLSLTCTTPPTPGPCINSTSFGTQAMPVLGSASFEIVSCQYSGEYSTWTGSVSNTPYIATSTIATDWITVRSGTYNGTIIAYGNQPLSFMPLSSETVYVHINSDSYCSTQSTCRDLSISRESALPVELLYFTGKQSSNINLLEWSTASEYNSDYFLVEVSKDGESWKSISQVNASTNSNQKIDYNTIHTFDEYTYNYYRLIQYDFDGMSKTYGPIVIDNRRQNKNILKYINTIGQEVPSNTLGIIFLVYEDGSMEKIYQ